VCKASVRDAGGRRVRHRLRDREAWLLCEEEAAKYALEFGPFTMDTSACCREGGLTVGQHGSTGCVGSQQPGGATHVSRTSFLRANACGANVWLNVPLRRAGIFLQHYMDCKSRAPTSTSAVLVLPKCPHKPWWALTQGMKVLHEYPAGSAIFTPTAARAVHGHAVQVTRRDVVVLWDPPRLEQPDVKPRPWQEVLSAELDAAASAEAAAEADAVEAAQELQCDAAEGAAAGEAGEQQEAAGNLDSSHRVIKLAARVHGRSIVAMLDCGASGNFLSSDLVAEQQIPTVHSEGQIRLINGDVQDASDVVPKLAYRVGSFVDKASFLVTDMQGVDMVLGKPWLTAFNPDIDWVTNTIRVVKDGVVHWLHEKTDSQPGGVELLTAMQFKRQLRKGAFAMLAVLEEVDAPEVDEDSEFDAKLSAAVNGPDVELRKRLRVSAGVCGCVCQAA
jgi:hypothetical protein